MLFSEELGIVLEVLPKNSDRVIAAFAASKLLCVLIGTTTVEKEVNVLVGTYVHCACYSPMEFHFSSYEITLQYVT